MIRAGDIIVYWRGSGWYASSHYCSFEGGTFTEMRRVGTDANVKPDLGYSGQYGLTWLDTCPVQTERTVYS